MLRTHASRCHMRAVAAFLALLAWSSQGGAVDSPMAGTWEVERKCSNTGYLKCIPESFSVRLFIKDGRLCGTHSSVAQGGNKVDELGGKEPTLTGQVSGKTATVAFRSSFEGKGKAAIALSRTHLRWHILEQDGEAWLPPDATLHRVRNTAWGSQLSCEWSK